MITEFEQISKANKIQQRFTAPYTPEHNGVSERLNRTLVEAGRALLIDAGLAKEFWSLAVKHVVYVKNRLYQEHLTVCLLRRVSNETTPISQWNSSKTCLIVSNAY